MKKIKILSIIALFGFGLFSCTDDKDELTGSKNEGGLISLNTAVASYVVGNGNTKAYPLSFTIDQGSVRTTEINVYKSFTNSANVKSNETLLKTIVLSPSDQHEVVNFSVNFNELIDGLSIAGVPLSNLDTNLNIGEAWTLRYEAKLSTGVLHAQAKNSLVSVATRFAGKYKVITGVWWRIGVIRPDVVWAGQFRDIVSINSTTYRMINKVAVWTPENLYFTISATDVVKPLDSFGGVAQNLLGFPVIGCANNPALMTNACGYSATNNIVIRDDVNGKDKIYISYGWNNPTGSRQVYEVLQKI